jgi:hypothetical protein
MRQPYENEVDREVIPAIKNRGGGFGQNLGADAFVDTKQMELHECPDCGRSFNNEVYDKHVRICNKVF